MKKFLYKMWAKFLTAFGDVKVFKWPFWLVYDPDDFQVTGDKVLEIMDILWPGDIVLRGFNRYLDGKFIPDPLKYSHGAIYTGDNKLVHAVAEGVSEINIVDFCQCDRIAIFRPKKYKSQALAKARKFLKEKTPYDFGFERGTSALFCFELCGECYDKLDVPKCDASYFFGLVKRKGIFLAQSFFKSKDMECVFQYNPKFNIDFRKI
jgi:uncharacterized protein YycO